MIKKLLVSSIILGAFSVSAFAADPLKVAGGKITFNGEVTSGACSVASGDADKIVTLDTVRSSVFKAADQLANVQKAFTITLQDCDTTTYKSVSVTFSGQSDATKTTLLANTAGAGSASGVALQLFGPNGKAVPLNTATEAVNLANGSSSTIAFSVDYMSTAAAVTAGKVQSVADFMLTYN